MTLKNLTKITNLLMAMLLQLNMVSIGVLASPQDPVLEIPKISLKQEFYPNDKTKNNVDKNIQVIETSQMPNRKNTNLILAAHSGNSSIAYFKHLEQLNINDVAYIHYQNKTYKYIINDIYDVEKTGYVNIKRNKNKQTLTLITCKKNTNKQTIYIAYIAP